MGASYGHLLTINTLIAGMSPNAGSVLGGTMVKITGDGFSDDDCLNLSVNLGEKYTCDIKGATFSKNIFVPK